MKQLFLIIGITFLSIVSYSQDTGANDTLRYKAFEKSLFDLSKSDEHEKPMKVDYQVKVVKGKWVEIGTMAKISLTEHLEKHSTEEVSIYSGENKIGNFNNIMVSFHFFEPNMLLISLFSKEKAGISFTCKKID